MGGWLFNYLHRRPNGSSSSLFHSVAFERGGAAEVKNFFVYTTGKLCRQVLGSTREISRKIFRSRAGAKSQSEEFAKFSGRVNV